MFKKTIVFLSVLLTLFNCNLVISSASDVSDLVINMGDSFLRYTGSTIIRDSKYIEPADVFFDENDSLVLAFQVSSAITYPVESYCTFDFYGHSYGTLTITLEMTNGSAYEQGGFILVDGQATNNYTYTTTGSKYIFIITGHIPAHFEIGAVFFNVTPNTIVNNNIIATIYSDASFIPDYSNMSEEIISNQTQNTQDIINNQNQNTQDIINNQNQQQQNEKEEANSSGNDGVDSIVGGIENKGEGFFNAMGNLISAMSYNGTECKWILPPITLPKIDGVMDSITLTDNLEIDFEYWISQIPSSIMRVVQAILTIAVILFCVKELYSILSYVFTLRGG